MNPWRVSVEGIGLWSPALANFDAFCRLLAGEEPGTPMHRPHASILSPHERRRAPESVLVAVEVAQQAVNMSRHAPDSLACVFASAYGDQATTDYMCRILAQAATEFSPTRFHNSVHNATAGYWTIATRCRAPSSAVCGGSASFGAGLIEAAAQACVEQRPVLLVCSDTAGAGPLGDLTGCKLTLGCALVLSPDHDIGMGLRLNPLHAPSRHPPLPAMCTTWMHHNPSAACLPLLAMLARGTGECVIAASERLGLQVQLEVPA